MFEIFVEGCVAVLSVIINYTAHGKVFQILTFLFMTGSESQRPRYAWWGTDWIPISCLVRMEAARLSSFSQVFINSSVQTLTKGMLIYYNISISIELGSLAGVTSLQTLQSPDNSIQPDFYTNQISDFLTLKAATV